MHDGIEIIDAQVHCWESLRTPHWAQTYRGAHQDAFSADLALAAMDAVGVDGAILDVVVNAPLGSWGDNHLAESAATRHPGRFASVVRDVDPAAADAPGALLALRQRPGVVGVRLSITSDAQIAALCDGSYAPFLSTMEREGLPLFLYVIGRLDLVDLVARTYPELAVLIVHMGIPQPPRPFDDPPFLRLPELLGLAKRPNVVLGMIGALIFSQEPYPHADLRPELGQLLETFTVGRVVWGSDFTRLWGRHSYADAFGYLWHEFGLSPDEKAQLFGANLKRFVGWETGTSGP